MLGIIHEIVLIAMILLAVAVIEQKHLLKAVIAFALLNLMLTIALFQLKAPDVALSAIVVSALLIGIFLYTIEEVGTSRNR
ncbi:MAG: hydrogenase subunit MbhD domain-containing protein [Thermoplasmatota archaeon]